MKLELKRRWFTQNSTIGVLYVDGVVECFTLEDVVREVAGAPVSEWKVAGATAIPYGEYVVELDMSHRFHRMMPHIMGVPGFVGVRITGNTAEDTEGCILMGIARGVDRVQKSRLAFEQLFAQMDAAWNNGNAMRLVITAEPVSAPVEGEAQAA